MSNVKKMSIVKRMSNVKKMSIVKKMSNVKKISNFKKSKRWTTEEVHQKIEIDIIRFTHGDANFDVICEGHQSWSKILSANILRVS